MLTTMIVKIVDLCARRAWIVMGLAVLVAFLSVAYAAGHFAINTNSADLISSKLPWRQRQNAAEFHRIPTSGEYR